MSDPKNQNSSQGERLEIQLLESQIKHLAKEWWGVATSRYWKKGDTIRREYYTILERLYKELKWDEPLEIDDELPKELMPEYYLKLFPDNDYDESFGTDFVEHYDNLYKKTGNEIYDLHRKKDKSDDPE